MSRSGYSDDIENWDLIRWRGAVNSAIRGARGQALLRELVAALDAMPVKELIAHELVTASGQVCALGAVAKARGLDVSKVDVENQHEVARVFGIARALACEIEFMNDEYGRTPAARWMSMRSWAIENLKEQYQHD